MPGGDLLSRVRDGLSGRYRVERELGRGGMAFVYEARDLRHDRRVALKVIRPDLTSQLGPERFLREVRVTAQLAHPHIRPLLDSGQTEGILYYVMPFIEGETLADRLEREGRLPLEDALEIARDMADALHHAHEQEIIHRDVKPGNIFLESGHAILSDFGIALPAAGSDSDRMTSTEISLGTPEYMSPEQCAGERELDRRSDLYALGCVLYEMLTGEPPFTGRTRMAVVARQVAETPTSVKLLRPDVPAGILAIVEGCLAKTPGDRFPDGASLRDALDDVLAEERVPETRAVPSSWKTRLLRGRSLAYLLAGLAVLAVGLWAAWPGDLEAVDAEKVVVYPLADRGGGGERGVDVALMIGNALTHTEPLRWLDGWQSLTPAERSDPSRLELERARQIALDRRAATFILGGITRNPDSVTVLLSLHDTRGDSVLAQASASGPAVGGTANQVGLRAIIQLLPGLLGSGQDVDLSFLTDRNPRAVARWLQGDRAYRQARFSEALELYREAVERDSLLALAGLKGAQAASWTERLDTAEGLIRLAVAHDSVLPPRYRSLAGGFDAYLHGDADAAASRFRDALELNREWSEAWMALGEVYRHLLPTDLVVDVSDREAFQEAARWDPDFLPPRIHLAEAAIREGDEATARRLVEELEGAPEVSLVAAVRLAWRCVEVDLEQGEWIPAVREDPVDAAAAAHLLLEAPPDQAARCAEEGLRAVLSVAREQSVRWSAVQDLNALLVQQDRIQEAEELLASTEAEGISAALFLYILNSVAGAGPIMEARAQGVDSLARTRWGPSFGGLNDPLTLSLLGVWHAHKGDLPSLSAVHERLRSVTADDDEFTRVLRESTEARLLVARGDTARAISVLRGLESPGARDELSRGLTEPLAVERLLLARLLLATGSPAEAWEEAAILDHPAPVIFPLFRPASLSLRARAADALPGDRWRARSLDARERLEALGRSDLIPQPPS